MACSSGQASSAGSNSYRYLLLPPELPAMARPPVWPGERRGAGRTWLQPVLGDIYCNVQKDAFLLWVCCFSCHPPKVYVPSWDSTRARWYFLHFWLSVLDPKVGKTPPCDNQGERGPCLSPGRRPGQLIAPEACALQHGLHEFCQLGRCCTVIELELVERNLMGSNGLEPPSVRASIWEVLIQVLIWPAAALFSIPLWAGGRML